MQKTDEADGNLAREVHSESYSYATEENLVKEGADRWVYGALETIKEDRTRGAVADYFGLFGKEPRTYRQIADQMGLTAEATRGIVQKGIRCLRSPAVRRKIDCGYINPKNRGGYDEEVRSLIAFMVGEETHD